MMFWKVLDGYTAAVSGTNYRYPGKGRWTKHLDPDKLEHYKYGYHVAEDENLLNHLRDADTIWRVDICPDHEPLRVGGKTITCRVRLWRRQDIVEWYKQRLERS